MFRPNSAVSGSELMLDKLMQLPTSLSRLYGGQVWWGRLCIQRKFGHYLSVPRFFGRIDVDKVDLVKFPKWKDVEWWYVDLDAGDCVYIPSNWYHQVKHCTFTSWMNPQLQSSHWATPRGAVILSSKCYFTSMTHLPSLFPIKLSVVHDALSICFILIFKLSFTRINLKAVQYKCRNILLQRNAHQQF